MSYKYQRWLKNIVQSAMKTRRVLLLSGARQCGKTTLARELLDKNSEYRTLDDIGLRQLAASDPNGFVKHNKSTLIIDEVQRVPALLSAIKMVVDTDTRPGQYLLTGSANIQSLPGAQESLAGRVRKLRLRTLCQGEISGCQPTFLERAFAQDFKQNSITYERSDILKLAARGGFAEVLLLSEQERASWHKDYVQSLIERDLKDIAQISKQDAMHQLIEVLAAWSSKTIDIAGICSGLSIRRPTVESYLNALEAMYLVERVRPWIKTDYDRVGKHAKLFMNDGGLMASILGWRLNKLALDADRSGKLIETFAFNEVAAQIDASENDYNLFYYRDREKREIDLLIENDNGDLLGIEVKAASVVHQDDFKHLAWFRDNIAKERHFVGIVLYTGQLAGSMGERLWAVPFGSLWST